MSEKGDVAGLVLEPGEKGILGTMTVENLGTETVQLAVRGKGPVLREKMIIRAEDATTPALRVYYTVQSIYLAPDRAEEILPQLGNLVTELVNAVPSTGVIAASIGEAVLGGDYQGALGDCLELLRYEEFLEKRAVGKGQGPGGGS